MQKRVQSNSRLDLSVVHLLHRVGQCADNLFGVSAGNCDITPSQYAVLSVAAQQDGLSQTAIVDAIGIDRSTTADIVKRLCKRGWLQRRRTKQDARAYAVRLTDEGRKALKIGEGASRQVDEKVLAALPAARRERLLEALGQIATTFSRP